jgi:hypothetical protein
MMAIAATPAPQARPTSVEQRMLLARLAGMKDQQDALDELRRLLA